MLRIGLISDTHGLLRCEAKEFLRGCDHIIHGGDVGRPEVLSELAELAALSAVRGNNDIGDWVKPLPDTLRLELGGVSIFVLHDLKDLKRHAHAGAQVVICGHSHKPQIARDASGLLVVNPGSAGPRRFKLPVTAAELVISGEGELASRIVDLLAAAS
jgi:uncharacterized protein